jgi:hypothetical protein
MRRLLTITALTLLAALAPSAPLPADTNEPGLFFVVTKGSEWVYTYTPGSGEGATQTVTGVEDKAGAKVVTIGEVKPGGRAEQLMTLRVAADGVWVLGTGVEDWEPPLLWLKLPHAAGAAWEAEVARRDKRTGSETKARHRLTAHGPEEVRVPAGTFQAIRVVNVADVGGLKREYTAWFAAVVGIVQTASPSPTVASPPGKWESRLKLFTPGKNWPRRPPCSPCCWPPGARGCGTAHGLPERRG